MLPAVNFVLTLTLLGLCHCTFVNIRGGDTGLQRLPKTFTNSWRIWTYDIHKNVLTPVENGQETQDGWTNPTSYDSLYLPADLPSPRISPALGVVVVHGSPRYIMPSVILSLETPDRKWRNRGLCSLPRAHAWIDLFGPFVANLDLFRLSYFGQYTQNVRFLEDQDGTTAWGPLLQPTPTNAMKSEISANAFEVAGLFADFKDCLKAIDSLEPLRTEGYNIVDIPLFDETVNDQLQRLLPVLRMQGILTDFEEPERLLALEDPSEMDFEPCGEISCKIERVAAGGKSKFLPEVSEQAELTK